jgi:hypothetical protein
MHHFDAEAGAIPISKKMTPCMWVVTCEFIIVVLISPSPKIQGCMFID